MISGTEYVLYIIKLNKVFRGNHNLALFDSMFKITIP